MYRNTQNGFTLVELSIVLVIIGLIVSSVLVGQELIRSAELRATTSQYQKFQTAVNTFIGKYNGIPGDIQGETFGLTDANTGNGAGLGDSNGTIQASGGGIAAPTGETADFWSHLTTPGRELVEGSYAGGAGAIIGQDVPRMKFSGNGWGVYGIASRNYFVAGIIANAAYHTRNAFVPLDAFSIDEKVDDGVPTTGTIVALQGQTAGTPDMGVGLTTAATATFSQAAQGSTTTHCVATTPTPDEYQFQATSPNCVLRFDMSTF